MIKIYQVNDINPELLETQLASFQKYLREDFEFIVVGNEDMSPDSPDLLLAKQVREKCAELGIRTIKTMWDTEIENAWQKNASLHEYLFGNERRFRRGKGGDMFNYTLQWVWQRLMAREKGPVAFIHTDIFLVEPIKLTDYLVDQPLCCVVQSEPNTNHPEKPRLYHFWEALLLADPKRLPQPETMCWFPARVEGTWMDTGASTYHYWQAHPDLKMYDIPQYGCIDDPDVDFHPARYQWFHLGDKKVLHYQSGSKWCTDMSYDGCWKFTKEQSDEYHARKLAWARRLIGL